MTGSCDETGSNSKTELHQDQQRPRREDLAVFREDRRVDGIGLGELFLGACVIAHLPGVDGTDWCLPAGGFCKPGWFVASGRIANNVDLTGDLANRDPKVAEAFGSVGEASGCLPVCGVDIEFGFANSDA